MHLVESNVNFVYLLFINIAQAMENHAEDTTGGRKGTPNGMEKRA